MFNHQTHFSIEPIGVIHSPYKQKFAIPRQPRIISEAKGQLEILAPYNQIEAFSGIEAFSHLWLVFIFHETMNKQWSTQVRPPRLGGNVKKGVFSTRSPFRPNSIGMSAVELLNIQQKKSQIILEVSGIDLLDGTPIIDIKPYISYSDSIEKATTGFAKNKPSLDMPVEFTEKAKNDCKAVSHQYPFLAKFISKVLNQDPRPAYKKNNQEQQEYAVYLYDFNVKWCVKNNINQVFSVEKMDKKTK